MNDDDCPCVMCTTHMRLVQRHQVHIIPHEVDAFGITLVIEGDARVSHRSNL